MGTRRQAFRNEVMYGAPSWYDWSIKNWGTKWNSYGYDNLDRSDISENPAFSFYTAWSAPHPIIEKLAERYPEVSFEHEWADEDIGMNCGRKTYEHGECTETYYPEAKETEIFANNLWGYETDTEMTEEQTL